MNNAAAFQATFSDWKLIKGRKVVQVVLEIPLELADQAYRVLGGMPDPGKSVWCAVARLRDGVSGDAPEEAAEAPMPQPAASRPRSFTSLPLPQQAALLCQDPIFIAFMREEQHSECSNAEEAAEALRLRCAVRSRSELKPDTREGREFISIREQFMAWKLVSA